MRPAGYREVEHTADWELEVWADDLPGLLEQAARGMYALMRTRLEPAPHITRALDLPAGDPERLLVAFLSELLWLAERDGLGFDQFDLQLTQDFLHAHLQGGRMIEQSKEIKAVTFHNLAIRRKPGGLEVNIVFDV